MVARRRLALATGRRPQRRKLIWARTFLAAASANARVNTDLLANIATQTRPLGPGCTVMRTHVRLAFAPTGGVWAGTSRVVVGLIVDDVATASTPDPAADFYADWMHLDWLTAPSGSPMAAGTQMTHIIDSKAKRRLDEAKSTQFLIFTPVPGTGTFTGVDYCIAVSTLIALP